MPKISELPAAVSVADADDVAIVQGGTTKKADASLFRDYIAPYVRNVPRIASVGEVIDTDGIGHCYSATGTMEVPASVFAAGDTVSIYNATAGNLTLTQGSGLTLRLAGTATTGSRTLSQRSLATIWFESATEAIVIGAGVT